MAQIDEIFEQVDEQLEADQSRRFWNENKKWIIGGLVLLFAGLILFVQWRDAQLRESQKLSDLFLQSQVLQNGGDRAGSEKILAQLISEGSGHGYGLLAHLVDAHVLANAGQNDQAVARLESVAAQTSGSPLQGLALLNAAYLTADDEEKSRSFLNKIAEDSTFKAHALELDGLLYAQSGDQKTALTRYREALALGAEGALRSRLNRRLESLAANNE
ncbi:MAG: tetratricopeptide repeat protein [Magnetococcales bacterium]|nr:tetratricopeptide repeat protein [Magnetococcales bacterium]